MRMSNESTQHLGDMGAPPDSLSGTVEINGVSYNYKNGVFQIGGQWYMVSDARDIIITADTHKTFMAIVNGVGVPFDKLPPATTIALKQKYGL